MISLVQHERTLAHALREFILLPNDTLCICLPDIPERDAAVSACHEARLHYTEFPLRSLQEGALVAHLQKTRACAILVTDWSFVDGKFIPTKTVADRASIAVASLDHIIVIPQFGRSISWLDGRDILWEMLTASVHPLD